MWTLGSDRPPAEESTVLGIDHFIFAGAIKLAREGAAIEWHRDADRSCTLPGVPIFNVDFFALLHDILLLHGSPASSSGLRRVVYYEFRPAQAELPLGPPVPAYIRAKQRVLLACLRDRAGEI